MMNNVVLFAFPVRTLIRLFVIGESVVDIVGTIGKGLELLEFVHPD